MTNKYTKKVPTKVKRQILSESLDPECVVSKLASKYGVSKQSIYCWRKEYFVCHPQASTSASMTNGSSFVELPIISIKPIGNDSKRHVLEKVSLLFYDFTFVLEGRVPTSSLVAILNILEELC